MVLNWDFKFNKFKNVVVPVSSMRYNSHISIL